MVTVHSPKPRRCGRSFSVRVTAASPSADAGLLVSGDVAGLCLVPSAPGGRKDCRLRKQCRRRPQCCLDALPRGQPRRSRRHRRPQGHDAASCDAAAAGRVELHQGATALVLFLRGWAGSARRHSAQRAKLAAKGSALGGHAWDSCRIMADSDAPDTHHIVYVVRYLLESLSVNNDEKSQFF
jgi:hypothetical protein